MSKKVITFGEIMLRLATPGYKRIIQADSFDVTYGGGEANVAVSLANYGLDAYFVTKLPDNEVGESCRNYIRRFGAKTDYIKMDGDRLGIYFLETGASQRPSVVVYDRADSAIAKVKPGEFDWQTIFKDADWFHFTGITPAISKSAAEASLEAVKAAKAAEVTVSCDLNYRKKLWTQQKAQETMTKLMDYVDVLIANEEDAEKVFDISAQNTDVHAGEINTEGYRQVAKKLIDRFEFEKVAITLRESYSASDNGWSAMFYDGKQYYESKKYDIRIVDRVGGGDSFCGGLIYGLIEAMEPDRALNFAVAASCLKHTIHGDFNLISKKEVENLMDGDGSGRVQR